MGKTSGEAGWRAEGAPLCITLFRKDFIYSLLERKKEWERNIRVWLPPVCPPLGPGPQPRHVPQTGNQTSDPLVRRPVLTPQSHTSRGCCSFNTDRSAESEGGRAGVGAGQLGAHLRQQAGCEGRDKVAQGRSAGGAWWLKGGGKADSEQVT